MERPAWKNPTRAYCEQADNISGIFLAMTPHCALLLAATLRAYSIEYFPAAH